MEELCKLAGHSSITVTARFYIHVSEEALRFAVEQAT
jgi:hypothetical protein